MKFRDFLNKGEMKMRKDMRFNAQTLKHIADEKSPDYAWIKLGLFMLGKSTRFNVDDEFKVHLAYVFKWFSNLYSAKNINAQKDFMSEVNINTDLDVLKLIKNEETPELAYIYTALLMLGKGLDFDAVEEFRELIRQSVEGCSIAIAGS